MDSPQEKGKKKGRAGGKAAAATGASSTPGKKKAPRKTGAGSRSGINAREQGASDEDVAELPAKLALDIVKKTQQPDKAEWTPEQRVQTCEHMIDGSGNDWGRLKLIRASLFRSVSEGSHSSYCS
jgi:hypothetical protein